MLRLNDVCLLYACLDTSIYYFLNYSGLYVYYCYDLYVCMFIVFVVCMCGSCCVCGSCCMYVHRAISSIPPSSHPFELKLQNSFFFHVKSQLPGFHNRPNCLAVCCKQFYCRLFTVDNFIVD